ncbi:MAG: hypothetical protein KIS76_03885 [Pyrinomonadaceae bacterium]|nr:hypothetical protein [Pyrinomonadaceae bacterium]
MESVRSRVWSARGAVGTIRRTTRSVYEFYRLRDLSPFGGKKSPVRLRLGGPDRVSIAFFSDLDHFYFSKFADNTSDSLKKFFVKEYFQNGAALFGRQTSESLDDFRKALGEKYKNNTDRQINTIVTTGTQRIRNWAHVGTLSQARIKYARYAATLDERTTDLCRGINGKRIAVGTAQKAIERLNGLEPGEFAKELYESTAAKNFRKDPVGWLETEIGSDGTVSEKMTKNGFAIPPLHANCRTRLEGIIGGVDE